MSKPTACKHPLINVEAEERVVTTLLVFQERMADATAKLSPADFSDKMLGAVFGVMTEAYKANADYSGPLVMDRIRARWPAQADEWRDRLFALEAPGAKIAPSHLTANMRLVKDLSTLRAFNRAVGEMVKESHEVRAAIDHSEVVSFMEDAARRVAQLSEMAASATGNMTAADALDLRRIEATKPKETRRGPSFNLMDLDDLGAMLMPGRLVVVGARPRNGKSTMLLHAALEAIKQGFKTLYVSLEMPHREMADRIAARETQTAIPIKGEAFRPETYDYAARDRFAKDLSLACPPRMNTAELYSVARDAKRRGTMDFLVVDYLQKLTPRVSQQNARVDIAIVARHLKEIALELDVPVFTGAQLNRDGARRSHSEDGEYGEPYMEQLKESGAIEEEADVVMLQWLGKRDAQQLDLKVEKNRQGREGKLRLDWQRDKFLLRNAAPQATDLMAPSWNGY